MGRLEVRERRLEGGELRLEGGELRRLFRGMIGSSK